MLALVHPAYPEIWEFDNFEAVNECFAVIARVKSHDPPVDARGQLLYALRAEPVANDKDVIDISYHGQPVRPCASYT